MAHASQPLPPLEVHPVTPGRWADLERLFGPNGAYGGCWCMWWRTTRAEFRQGAKHSGQGNRRALKAVVDSGTVPGVLAYAGGEPVGWCSVAPRDDFPSLDRSRVLKRVDASPVWSIACFYVARPYRRRGLMAQLIRGAVDYAAGRGAKIVEAYPIEPLGRRVDSGAAYVGFPAAFRAAGFTEVVRRSERRPIMRYVMAEPATTG